MTWKENAREIKKEYDDEDWRDADKQIDYLKGIHEYLEDCTDEEFEDWLKNIDRPDMSQFAFDYKNVFGNATDRDERMNYFEGYINMLRESLDDWNDSFLDAETFEADFKPTRYKKKGWVITRNYEDYMEATKGNRHIQIHYNKGDYEPYMMYRTTGSGEYYFKTLNSALDWLNGDYPLYEGGKDFRNAESEAATYSPSSSPDMVNEIQTSPTNESPQLFNASNTFNVTTALGIGGLVVAALSLPMLYSSAKSRLGKSAEEKRKASGSVRRNHTQVKNSEYSVGQVNPVEAEGQQDIHGAEGITNPRHAPSASPAGYPSHNT